MCSSDNKARNEGMRALFATVPLAGRGGTAESRGGAVGIRDFTSNGDQRECFGAAGRRGGNQAWEVVQMETA